jgi:maleate isomerase
MEENPGGSMQFAEDGFGSRARIGLVYIASSVVMEPEMYAMAPAGVSIHTSRLHLPEVTVQGIDAMMRSPQLEEASRLLGEAPLSVICFGGTSASFLHGTAWDQALTEKLKEWTPGIPAVTTATSVLDALSSLGVERVALATPYIDDVSLRAVKWLEENAHPVVSWEGLGVSTDWELAEITPQTVYDLAVRVDRPEADAVFISCTNLRTVAVIGALEQALAKPVVSAVQASFWKCLMLAQVEGAKPGYGRLFDEAPR